MNGMAAAAVMNQQYAFERLRHCAEQACTVEVVIVQENDDYDSRARLWERQLEDSIKAGVHKAKVETKRKAASGAYFSMFLSKVPARQQAALGASGHRVRSILGDSVAFLEE